MKIRVDRQKGKQIYSHSMSVIETVIALCQLKQSEMGIMKDYIKALEEKLLHSDVSANPNVLDELLGDDFEEIGSIGNISTREQVINWLITKDKDMQWSLTEFRVRELSPDLILATYRANKKDRINSKSAGSMRCSIWKKFGSHWKMIFHQATKIQKVQN